MTPSRFRQEAWIGCGIFVPTSQITHRRPGTTYHVIDPDRALHRIAEDYAPPVHRCGIPYQPPSDDAGPEVIRAYNCSVQMAGLASDSMHVVRVFNVPMDAEGGIAGHVESILETAVRILAPGGRLYIGASCTPMATVTQRLIATARRLGAVVSDEVWGGANAIEFWRALSEALGFRFRVLVPPTPRLAWTEPHRIAHRSRWLMAVNFGSIAYQKVTPETHLIRMQRPLASRASGPKARTTAAVGTSTR